MAIQLKDRIFTLCTTTGTGDLVIGATKDGYQGWGGITYGNTVYYCITDNAEWEVGYGNYLNRGSTQAISRTVLSSSNNGEKINLSGNSSIFCTYPSEKAVYLNLDGNIEIPSSNINAKKFSGDGGGITNINAETNNLAPEAPTDGETYARNNKTWVSISDSSGIPDAPVDGTMYGRKDGEWENVADADDVYTKTETNVLLDNKANVGDSYLKAETYSSVEVDGKLFEKADKATTYTKTEVDSSQALQDTEIAKKANQATTYTKDESDALNNAQNSNISANTTAIGTLSGQVANNSEDIATLQDGIFFSSSYTTDYPSNPNRDPETGNIYLQNLSAFTYSYADANQVFISKTDEQGNVRQFTAVKPDDILVLNQVESPNYGRYKVSTVNDLGDYVNIIMEFQTGEGTVLEGDTLALQAFPASAGGGGGEGTVADGCIYLNNQTIISDYTIPTGKNGMSSGPIKFDGTVTVPTGSAYHVVDSNEDSIWTDVDGDAVLETDGKKLTIDANVGELGLKSRITTDANILELKAGSGGIADVTIADTGLTTVADLTVNGMTVGVGNNPSQLNTVVGLDAFQANTTGQYNVALGREALKNNTEGNGNIGIGVSTLFENTTGSQNIAIGQSSQKANKGTRNTTVGHNTLRFATEAKENTGIGWGCMNGMTTGSVNTAVGDSALTQCETGGYNVAVGNAALTSLISGDQNVGIGRSAGNSITTGTNNICIGYQANPSSPTVNNEVTIGNDDITATRLKGIVKLNTCNTNSVTTNMLNYIPSTGAIERTNTSFYSSEEMDKKLKIIEKLEARLTKLEARIK